MHGYIEITRLLLDNTYTPPLDLNIKYRNHTSLDIARNKHFSIVSLLEKLYNPLLNVKVVEILLFNDIFTYYTDKNKNI